jgi:hypothetical protein
MAQPRWYIKLTLIERIENWTAKPTIEIQFLFTFRFRQESASSHL